jgi:hypothetical protein
MHAHMHCVPQLIDHALVHVSDRPDPQVPKRRAVQRGPVEPILRGGLEPVCANRHSSLAVLAAHSSVRATRVGNEHRQEWVRVQLRALHHDAGSNGCTHAAPDSAANEQANDSNTDGIADCGTNKDALQHAAARV